MSEPPFMAGKPVTGEYFINREEDLKQLTALLSSAGSGNINNIMVLGLRRTGKTSLLVNAANQITSKSKKLIPVMYDCMGTSTKSMFARLYVDTILNAYMEISGDKAYQKKLSSIIRKGFEWSEKHVSEFEIGLAEYVKLRIQLNRTKPDEDELLRSALKYPEELAKAKKIKFVIMLDEFQELLKWGEDFLRMLRTIVQSQKNVAYTFSGSAPTVIRNLVYKQRSPFYKQLTEIQVKKLPEETVREFVKSRLGKVKMNISSSALDQVVYLTSGFPDYVQRLGLTIYLRLLSRREWHTIEESDVESSYEHMLTQLDGEFSTFFSTLSDFEKNVLIALARGNSTYSSMATEIRKPISSIPAILNRLLNADVVERYKEGSYRISDPVFTEWIAIRYEKLSL